MQILNSGNVVRLRLDQITVGKRLRAVGHSQVQNLILMAQDTGITTPIHVRKTKDGYDLIDGAHRLAAAYEMGDEDIASLVVECRQDEARAMEASNNLGAARMTPLQTAVFVASWKRDYYAMHPERKPGVFKGNQHSGKVVEEMISLTTSIAGSFGITERHARNMLAVGERLSPNEIAQLDAPERRVALADLLVLSKISEPTDRAEVVSAMVAGAPVSAGKGWAAIKARKAGVQPTIKDPVDTAFLAMSALWTRMPLAAKKRFCLEFGKDIWAVQNRGAALTNWRAATDE